MVSDKSAYRIVISASVLLAAVFLLAGLAKLFGLQVDQFAIWGYPAWFQYAIGAAEVALAVGLVMRATRFPAAAGVIVLMLGALYTHIARADGAVATDFVTPIACLLLAAFVATKSR